jgi:hypothetical protein
MTITDREIEKIAAEAVSKVFDFETPPNPEEKKCEVSYEIKAQINETSYHKPYYHQQFYGLTTEAKAALEKAYGMRKTPLSDKQWIDLYVKFTEATNKEFYSSGKSGSLEEFRTMAVFYCERYKNSFITMRKSLSKGEAFFDQQIDKIIDDYRNRYAGADLC